MKIQLRNGLPYVSIKIVHHNYSIELSNVLLDTGSAGSIFSADKLQTIGIQYEPNDIVHRIRGVGGSEFVFTKQIERLALGNIYIDNFRIEIGAMDYGFEIDGIIGMDFLTRIEAVIDLMHLEINLQMKKD